MPAPPPAPGENRSPALALVNTELEPRGGRIDLLTDSQSTVRWLAHQAIPQPTQVSEGDIAQLRNLRAAIREIFVARISGTTPAKHALATLNAAARATPRAPQLAWTDQGPQRQWTTHSTRAQDAAKAALAADAIDIATGTLGDTLRSCEAHGCMRLFLQDHGRRRWCSTTCGDRVRVARHYAKTRA